MTGRRKIAWHYVASFWFIVDVLSIGVSLFDILAPTSGPLASAKGFRAIRALRLIKLARLVNTSRIFKRWELKLSINYGVLSISMILLGLIYACHLFACVWGLQASFDPLDSWFGPQHQGSPLGQGYCVEWDPTTPCPNGQKCNDEGYSCLQPVTLYIRAFYFAVTTVTSTGYGDVAASKLNATENLVCTAIMYIGAVCFAYIVGSFCGVATNLAPDKAQFRIDLSDLNFHMAAENIPPEMQYRLREYMHLTVHLRQGATRVRLLQLLSPFADGGRPVSGRDAAVAMNNIKVLELFREWDKDGNGMLDKHELRRAVKTLGFVADVADCDAIFEAIDESGDGQVDFDEMKRALNSFLKGRMPTPRSPSRSGSGGGMSGISTPSSPTRRQLEGP